LIQPGHDIDQISLDYLFGGITYSSGTEVDITVSGGDGPPPSFPPGDPGLSAVTCVATAGGQWVAAGGQYDPAGSSQPPQGGGTSEAAYLVTDDAGNQHWERIDPPGTNAIIAMCGGLLSDVKPEPAVK
jgi:hypothetical protein